MKYIKEYSEFINEGYVDIPNDVLKDLRRSLITFADGDYDNINELIESFNNIMENSDFPCTIEMLGTTDIKERPSDDDDFTGMIHNTKYSISYDTCIEDASFDYGDEISISAKRNGPRYIKSGAIISFTINPYFLDIYTDAKTLSTLENTIKHELGHAQVFRKIIHKYIDNYFSSNPDSNNLNVTEDTEKFLHAYKIKNLNTPDTKNLKYELFLNSDLMQDMTASLHPVIKDIRKEGYSIKSIVDFKKGPFTLDKYKKIFNKYNKDEQNVLKYLIQATFDETLKHDLSKEEFAVDVTSITSELLMHNPDISVAIDIVAKSSKPNTPSNTFNHYLHVVGNKTKEFNTIRKMLYLNLQNIANNLNVKVLTDSGIKLLK